MGTLNPNIPSKELTTALNASAKRMRALGRPFITPAMLLLTFCRDDGSVAHRMLVQWSTERSFRLDDLAASAEALAKFAPDTDAQFNFLDEANHAVPLSAEMIIALDEARSIAQASGESTVGTEHALGGMAETGRQHSRAAAPLRHHGQQYDHSAGRPGADQKRQWPGPGRAGQERGRAGALHAGRLDARSARPALVGRLSARDPGRRTGRGQALAWPTPWAC